MYSTTYDVVYTFLSLIKLSIFLFREAFIEFDIDGDGTITTKVAF